MSRDQWIGLAGYGAIGAGGAVVGLSLFVIAAGGTAWFIYRRTRDQDSDYGEQKAPLRERLSDAASRFAASRAEARVNRRPAPAGREGTELLQIEADQMKAREEQLHISHSKLTDKLLAHDKAWAGTTLDETQRSYVDQQRRELAEEQLRVENEIAELGETKRAHAPRQKKHARGPGLIGRLVKA